MADYRPKDKQHKSEESHAEKKWRKIANYPTPDTFKIGREVSFQLAKVERDLFTDMEERESGNYIVSGIERKVSLTDFEAFRLGIGQILYNQSYQSDNKDTNSGVSKTKARKLSKDTGHTYYVGEVIFSLNDLCRYAFGTEPTKRDKEAIATLIDTLHDTPVIIQFPNGDIAEMPLASKMGKFTRAKDGAISYWLYLNPIFCENVKNNFAEYPQDFTKNLAEVMKENKVRRTGAIYLLVELLGKQDKRQTFIRTIGQLLYDLNLIDAYSANPTRTEKQLILYCDILKHKKIKLLKDYEIERVETRKRKPITKVTFHFDPSFTRRERSPKQGGGNKC